MHEDLVVIIFYCPHAALVGAMVDPPGVARMAIDHTLVDGEVGGALEAVGGAPVVVGGALPQGEAVDQAHEPLQVLNASLQYYL